MSTIRNIPIFLALLIIMVCVIIIAVRMDDAFVVVTPAPAAEPR